VRSRLLLNLIAVIVLLILTVMGFRACSTTAVNSELNPINVARNGLTGLCANAAAAAAAGGADPNAAPGTVVSPDEQKQLQASDPGGLAALQQAAGGSLSCPTATTGP
jgi:hypothetical protein